MVSKFAFGVGAAVMVALLAQSPVALAQQQGGGWFVPNQSQSKAPAQPAPRQQAAPRQVQHTQAPAQSTMPMGEAGAEQGLTPQQLQMQLPPAPDVPPMAKGSPTPAAIVGILSVPDVLRVSSAYQSAYKELNARAQKLNEDAQKEQLTLRDMGQAFANERAKLSPEQIRAKEREIQDRATEAQRKFGERNRIIQEAGQYVMAQINRTMEQVAQQVALSRGVNLVLNRAQILGTTADFDLTPAVAEVLNKVLPSVVVPPDGVSVMSMTPPKADEKPGATPASAPGSNAPGSNAPAANAPATNAPAAATPPTSATPAKPAKKP